MATVGGSQLEYLWNFEREETDGTRQIRTFENGFSAVVYMLYEHDIGFAPAGEPSMLECRILLSVSPRVALLAATV